MTELGQKSAFADVEVAPEADIGVDALYALSAISHGGADSPAAHSGAHLLSKPAQGPDAADSDPAT
jgi:hypothetical protein